MAKKNGALGKLIAVTTAVAAIGGICYIFRDKIMESPLFQSATDKANDLYDNVKNKINREDDDDFFFDDDDDFFNDSSPSESTGEREYTSISISTSDDNIAEDINEPDSETTSVNAGSDDFESSSATIEPEPAHDDNDTINIDAAPTDDNTNENDSIPTIDFGSTFAKPETVTGYENEGLSDVSEDPDTLEDMDKLDF